ncbi:polyprotein [Cirsium virus A]|nr:polyprotein [Cirsium virus A]
MDFEAQKHVVSFLRSSMGLQSISDIVETWFADSPIKQLIRIHLSFYHATCMVEQYNAGIVAMKDLQSAHFVQIRNAKVKIHAMDNILTGRGDEAWMRSYIKDACHIWFACDYVQVEEPERAMAEPSSNEDLVDEMANVKLGEGLVAFAKDVADKIFSTMAKFTTSALEKFLSCLQEAICSAFAPWINVIKGALVWFGNLMEVFKNWAAGVHDQIHNIFEGIEECIFLGMGLVAATCVVALIEKFLVASKIIASSCGAPTVFLTAALAVVAGSYCLGKAAETALPTSQLLMFVSTSCQTVLGLFYRQVDSKPDEYVGQFGPSIMLDNLAKLVSSWSTSTITEVGRTFGAIAQIKNGIVALRDMVVYVFSELGSLATKLLGFESQILADMAILLGENVASWLDECDAILAYTLEFSSSNREIFDRLAQLIEKGKTIRAGVLRTNHRGSPQVLNLVSKALEKLIDLHGSIVVAGSNGTRKAPFMVFFTGKAGTGKTSVVQRMAADWLKQEQLGSNEMYSRNGQDPFWSGYKRQAVVTYDDFGAVPGLVSNEAEIISVVSRNAFALQMADLKEKGMYFDSRLILASSNFLAASPESKVHDAEAYERRRHVVIRVSLKPGVPYNPAEPNANQEYEVLGSRSPFPVLERFESYEDLWAWIYTRFREHEETEKIFLSSLPIPDKTNAEVLEALIGISVVISGSAPKSVIKYCAEHHPGFHYLISEGENVYFWSATGEVAIVPISKISADSMDKATLKRDSMESALMYQNMAKLYPTMNQLAVLYAKRIVLNGWVREDLTPSPECTDNYMRDQITSLPAWQRAYLYVLSKHLSRRGPKGWFASCLDDTRKALRSQYIWEYKSWPMPLKLAVGSLVAILAGSAIWYTMRGLWGMCGDSSFIVGAASVFTVKQTMQCQSEPPNKVNGDFMFRNRKVRTRTWQGQACYGDSVNWLADNTMGTISFLGQTVQVCVMPGRGFLCINHVARLIPNKMMVQLDFKNATSWFVWDSKKLTDFKGNELALYNSSSLPLAISSLKDRVVLDPEMLPETFDALFFSYKINPVLNVREAEVASITCKVKTEALSVQYGEYQRKIARHLEYNNPTVDGDCGSLIIAEIKGKMCLVGIHVAGDGTSGSACFIPHSDSYFVQEGQSDFKLKFQEWSEPALVGPGCRAIGVIDPEHRVSTGGKTSFTQTPTAWHLDKPCDKIPSILSKNDERLVGTVHAAYDPFPSGMAKYAREAGPFEADTLQRVCGEILEEWYDAAVDFEFGDVDLNTAINGLENVEYFDALVLGTSEGFPYRLDRQQGEKGKSRYVVGEPGNLSIEDERMLADIAWFEETSKTQIPDLYCIECVKDERLPIRKVLHEPKSRLFSVLPMSYNLVVRKKFLNFVKSIMKSRTKLPCQVGINPYSREWGRLALSLLEKGDEILCCDYSRFDGFLPKCVMSKIAWMIAQLSRSSEEEARQMENLMLACTSRYALCEKIVYRVENGIPSGFPLTVIVNSVLNEILVRYAYHHCFKDNRDVQLAFNTFVKLVVYGDDNLISVAPTISSKFNGTFIVEFMRDLGIKITDGVDKTKIGVSFRKLSECDFLKRSFKENSDGTWYAPMNVESLWAQLHYVKASKIELAEGYVNNCNNIMRELWLHGPQQAKDFRALLLSRVKWVDSRKLLTLSQIANFHDEQQNHQSTFMKACHALENLDLIDPLEPGILPIEQRELCPGVYVATEGHCTLKLEEFFVVSISTRRTFPSIEDGVVVTFPYGVGRGGLPSTEFMRTNVLRKGCTLRKTINQGLTVKGKILFISQSSVVPAYVFAVLVLHALGKLQRGASNMALTSAVATCKTLKYLPKDFPEAF